MPLKVIWVVPFLRFQLRDNNKVWMAIRIRSFLAVWLGRVERQHPGALAHSSQWWPTTAGRGAAVKADSRRRRWPQASLYSGSSPSHPRTEDRWPECGIPSLRMPALSGLAAVPAGGAVNVARMRTHGVRLDASDRHRGMCRSSAL